MNVLAFILACIAIALFLCAYFQVPRRWARIDLGLAVAWASFVVELVWKTSHVVSIG